MLQIIHPPVISVHFNLQVELNDKSHHDHIFTNSWHAITENAALKFIMQALELAPTKLHDRSPIFLGSYDDVEEIKALYASESSTA